MHHPDLEAAQTHVQKALAALHRYAASLPASSQGAWLQAAAQGLQETTRILEDRTAAPSDEG